MSGKRLRIVDGKKPCGSCKLILPVSEFRIRKYKNGKIKNWAYSSSCRSCLRLKTKRHWINGGKERAKARRDGDRTKYREYARRYSFKKKYGLKLEDYYLMLKAQGGVCKICGNPPAGHGKENLLNVDHCHATGRIRGLLCFNCNNGLGAFKDNPHVIESAKKYLETFYGN